MAQPCPALPCITSPWLRTFPWAPMGGMGSASLMLMFLAQRLDKGAWGRRGLSCLGNWQWFPGRAEFLPFGSWYCWKRESGVITGGGPFLPNSLEFFVFQAGEKAPGVPLLVLVCFSLLGMEPRGLCGPGNVLYHQATVSALMGI